MFEIKNPSETDAVSELLMNFIFLKKFWLHRVLVAASALLSCGMQTLSWGMHVGSLPWPGIEPTYPALEGRFLTTAPPGKSPVDEF